MVPRRRERDPTVIIQRARLRIDRERSHVQKVRATSAMPVNSIADSLTDRSADHSSSPVPDSLSDHQPTNGRRLAWMGRCISFNQVDQDGMAVFEWETKKGKVLAVYFCTSCHQPFLESPLSTTVKLACDHAQTCRVQRPDKTKVHEYRIYREFWLGKYCLVAGR